MGKLIETYTAGCLGGDPTVNNGVSKKLQQAAFTQLIKHTGSASHFRIIGLKNYEVTWEDVRSNDTIITPIVDNRLVFVREHEHEGEEPLLPLDLQKAQRQQNKAIINNSDDEPPLIMPSMFSKRMEE